MNTKNRLFSGIAAMLVAGSLVAPTNAHDIGANVNANAQDVRVLLSTKLGEHVMLAASATGAALGGREAQFKAAAKSLDDNSVDISKAIGQVYGKAAEDAFLPLWRKHIGFFVDYTNGVAAKDKTKSDKAIADLVQYTEDFGAFLNSANPNLPKGTVAALVKDHVVGLKDVVDAQAAGDQPKVYDQLRIAYHHMTMIADPLAMAIVKQFPQKFGMQVMLPQTGADLSNNSNAAPAIAIVLSMFLVVAFIAQRRNANSIR